jgi:hypothetical protein
MTTFGRRLLLIVLLVSISFGLLLLIRFVFIARTGEMIDKVTVQDINLRMLEHAINTYHNDHGRLPLESEFKESLKGYVQDADVLSQARYYCEGNSFVLVAPGRNKKFDTPEGYKNIRTSGTETDDIIEFHQVPEESGQ